MFQVDKAALTNIIAAVITAVGFALQGPEGILFSVGVFALSGGVTNWLAVHMLFEKVPGLYGSGVITNRFEEFKSAIKDLLIEEFFAHEHIERFFEKHKSGMGSSMVGKVDFDRIFNGLADTIEASSLGGMLSMVGGKKALEPLREPVTQKLEGIITDLASGDVGDRVGQDIGTALIAKVEVLIDNRLAELTPEKVKEIVQDMIRAHLGWLVVWGGIFGGLIGLIVALLK